MRVPLRTIALTAGLGLTLAGCGVGQNPLEGGGGEGEGGPIVIGAANFTESAVLAELYAGAINAAGGEATTTPDISSREVYINALRDGSIDVVAEYSGNLLQYLDPESTASDAEQVDTELAEAVQPDFQLLDQSQAANQDVYVVTRATADESGVASLADLAGVSDDWVLGGAGELQERPYGPSGLSEVYGADFAEFRTYDQLAVKVRDLNDDQIQVGAFFSTDSAIAQNDYVVLEDPDQLVLPQNVVPLARADLADQQAVDAINQVQAALTTEGLSALNAQVDDERLEPAAVAEQWLEANGLAGS